MLFENWMRWLKKYLKDIDLGTHQYYYVIGTKLHTYVYVRERRSVPEKKKMGRPVIGQPKDIRLQIKIDEETKNKLDELCQKKEISYAECIRQLINKAK